MNTQTIQNRYEFMLLLEAKLCNPNGDPDMGNLPRQDPETEQGIITDVAIKRRIRNYIQDAFFDKEGMDILMQSGTSLNKKIAEAVLEVNEIQKFDSNFKNAKVMESAQRLAEKYWDVRAFGGVMSTGRNAGQIRGAVQIAMSTSVDPIGIQDMTITRMCYALDAKQKENESPDFLTIEGYEKEENERSYNEKRTMGNKRIATYGLYIVKGSISASLAEKVGFTETDLNALNEALLQMYNHDISSSKEGMSVVSPLFLFKHVGTQDDANAEEKAREAKLGCAAAHKLFNLMNVQKKTEIEYPRNYEDYQVSFRFSEMPKGVEVGIKTAPFSEVVWGDDVKKVLEAEGIKIV